MSYDNLEDKKLLTIDAIEQRVRERILTDFLETYKKPKLNFWSKIFIPLMPFLSVAGAGMFYVFFTHNLFSSNWGLLFFLLAAFCLAAFAIIIPMNFGTSRQLQAKHKLYKTSAKVGNYIRGYFNYAKESKKYFGNYSTQTPDIKDANQIEQYLIDKCDKFFTKTHIDFKSIEDALKLTPEEKKSLMNSEINDFQKQFLDNKGSDLNLYDLEEAKFFSTYTYGRV